MLAEDGRDPAPPGSARWSILRLGEEAAAELATIPDTPELQAHDHALAAACPPVPGSARPPIARRMLRLIERYRRECGLDRLERDGLFAELAARASGLQQEPRQEKTARAGRRRGPAA